MQRILVIDDDTTTTRLRKRGLCYAGYLVVVAESGEAGLTLVRDYLPDLVILDTLLPGIGGLEVLRRLRTANSVLPILILTAKDAPADQVQGLEEAFGFAFSSLRSTSARTQRSLRNMTDH